MNQGYPTLVRELEFQIHSRKKLALDKIQEYDSEDPINSLPLTEYQRGIIAGRAETWEFFEHLVSELKGMYPENKIALSCPVN
jgi:hypothetical protein